MVTTTWDYNIDCAYTGERCESPDLPCEKCKQNPHNADIPKRKCNACGCTVVLTSYIPPDPSGARDYGYWQGQCTCGCLDVLQVTDEAKEKENQHYCEKCDKTQEFVPYTGRWGKGAKLECSVCRHVISLYDYV